jgi:hypothetical protein
MNEDGDDVDSVTMDCNCLYIWCEYYLSFVNPFVPHLSNETGEVTDESQFLQTELCLFTELVVGSTKFLHRETW